MHWPKFLEFGKMFKLYLFEYIFVHYGTRIRILWLNTAILISAFSCRNTLYNCPCLKSHFSTKDIISDMTSFKVSFNFIHFFLTKKAVNSSWGRWWNSLITDNAAQTLSSTSTIIYSAGPQQVGGHSGYDAARWNGLPCRSWWKYKALLSNKNGEKTKRKSMMKTACP